MQSHEKLVIAHANFHLLWGGQAEVVLALGKCLAQRGHRLIIATPPGSELAKRAAAAGLETFTECHFRKGFRPLSFYKDVRVLGAFLKKNGVQIYHCHGSQDHWIGAVARRNSPRTVIVRSRHNIYPVKNHFANRWLFRKQTARVITIFEAQSKYLTESGLLTPENLFTLHSPLPQEFVGAEKVRRAVREEMHLTAEVPLIGFAANFHADKAPLDFVAMAEKIARQHPAALFAMAGHGPLQDAVKARVLALGLAERFNLLGFRKDIREVMASFDVLVLPSITREASSTVLKQAGAVGIPVVATDIGGTREIVDDGQTGFVVAPGAVEDLSKAVITLLRDPARARAMGQAGKEKVLREFTAAAIAERTESLYRTVLAEKNDAAHRLAPVASQ